MPTVAHPSNYAGSVGYVDGSAPVTAPVQDPAGMPSAAPTKGGLDRPLLAGRPCVVLLKQLGYVLGSGGTPIPIGTPLPPESIWHSGQFNTQRPSFCLETCG
jgi:hypothetical protein